ncbi:MAG TPA: hypothetical protein VGD17_06840 [Chitinophagaceae bacterium]
MKLSVKLIMASIAIASVTSCSKDPYIQEQSSNPSEEQNNKAIVIRASGDITDALNEFRELLGPLNTAPGATGGRREINWDGVPAALTNNDLFPGDFFGSSVPTDPNGRKRGLINTTPGDGFRISDNNFADLNPSYAGQFKAFSPAKTFIANNSIITDNIFKVPGTDIDATVQGFGVVFSDVNNAASTSLEFFAGQRSLGVFKVPNNGNNIPGAFSFLGVYFPNEKVTLVRIYSGNAPLLPISPVRMDGADDDLVIMDDFIYSEPQQ